MPLPKIDQPIFELKVPSTKEVIHYRPFTVKEEKILLIARESGEIDQIFLAIEQVVSNCIQEEIDVKKLATFDLEYIILSIRAKAVNDQLEFKVPDPESGEDEKRTLNLSFNVKDVKIARLDEVDTKIEISDEYFLMMRHPTLTELHTLIDKSKQSDIAFEVMISCIDKLVSSDGENIYNMSDFTKKEINDFVESLSGKAISSIQTFFQSIPSLRIECPYTNSKGEQKTFVIEGMQSFFM